MSFKKVLILFTTAMAALLYLTTDVSALDEYQDTGAAVEEQIDSQLNALLDADVAADAHENQSPREARQFYGDYGRRYGDYDDDDYGRRRHHKHHKHHHRHHHRHREYDFD